MNYDDAAAPARHLPEQERDDFVGLLYAAARLEGELHIHYVTVIVREAGPMFVHCNSLGEAANVAYDALRKKPRLCAVYLFGKGNVRLVDDLTDCTMPGEQHA